MKNINKLLKTSAYIIGLSAIIGTGILAIDSTTSENEPIRYYLWEVDREDAESAKSTSSLNGEPSHENEPIEYLSDRDEEEINKRLQKKKKPVSRVKKGRVGIVEDNLTLEEVAEIRSKKKKYIYDEEREQGKGHFYADYYSMLVVERNVDEEEARWRAEIYERERICGKSHPYADYFTERWMRPGRFFYVSGRFGAARLDASYYEEQIKSGKSEVYAAYYAENSYKILFYRELIERQARVFEKEIMSGKSEIYANYYAILTQDRRMLFEPVARRQTEVFESKMNQGCGFDYSDYFAKASVLYGMNEDKADYFAKIYVDENRKVRLQASNIEEEIELRNYAAFVVDLMATDGRTMGAARDIASSYKYLKKCMKYHDKTVRYYSILLKLRDESKAKWTSEDRARFDFRIRIYDQEVKSAKSHEYADYYASLCIEKYRDSIDRIMKMQWNNTFEDAELRKRAELYENELIQGKTVAYAGYYMNLISRGDIPEDMARKRAEVYESSIRSNHSSIYSDYYSNLVVCGGMDTKLADDIAKVYETEIKKRKSMAYAMCYASLTVKTELSEATARKYAAIYSKQVRLEGKSHDFAHYYIKSMIDRRFDEGLIDKQAEIYDETKKSGKSDVYSDYLALIKTLCGLDDSTAIEVAKEYEQQRNAGESHFYADCYAISRVVKHCNDRLSEQLAEVYESEMKCGRSRYYAGYYAELLLERHYDKKIASYQANRYADKMEANTKCPYGDYYLLLSARNDYEEVVKRSIDFEEREARLEKSEIYSKYYADLITNKGLSIPDARKQAKIYEEELINGKTADYADYYASLIVSGRSNKTKAALEAECYDKEVRDGKSKSYANWYVFLISSGLHEKEARISADICDKKSKEGKSKNYLEFYIMLTVFKNVNEKDADEMANRYEKEIVENGHSKEYSSYFVMLLGFRKIDEATARRVASVYEKEVLSGKSCEDADNYVRSFVLNDSDGNRSRDMSIPY